MHTSVESVGIASGIEKIVSGMMDKKRFEITAQNDR
jgi:hypothetical protein